MTVRPREPSDAPSGRRAGHGVHAPADRGVDGIRFAGLVRSGVAFGGLLVAVAVVAAVVGTGAT
ncbi:MAG TPA: hypothetical protein VII33_15760, partial [Nakamurella sp.]